jgi:hypothetical protein
MARTPSIVMETVGARGLEKSVPHTVTPGIRRTFSW